MSEKTLKNGLKIITIPQKNELVSINLFINKGSYDEKEDELGIAHLVEHLVFKGTANYDKRTIWNEIEKNGGMLNAFTSQINTAFETQCLKENMEKALDVITELVFLNTIPEEEFELEKSVVIEELKMYDNDIKEHAMEFIARTIFPNNKNHFAIGGSPESVKAITRQQVLNWIERNYIPQNATLVVTGDVSEKFLVNFMEEKLQDFEFVKQSPEIRDREVEPQFTDAKRTKDGSQSAMGLVFPLTLVDDKENLMQSLVEQILCGGFGSRLMRIREDYGFVYGIRFGSMSEYIGEKSAGLVFCLLNNQNIPKAQELIKEYFDEFYQSGATEKEFIEAVNYAKYALLKSYETVQKTNDSVVNNLASESGIYTKEDSLKLLDSISLEDLNKFVKEKYKDLKMNCIIVEQTR